ncbi:MAG: hypothetical protein AB8B50_19915 [Pirellulaceae bacterium]
MQQLEATKESEQHAILMLAEHFGIVSPLQTSQAQESMRDGSSAIEALTKQESIDASDVNFLRRKLSDLCFELDRGQGKVRPDPVSDASVSVSKSFEDATYLQTQFEDDAEVVEEENDWQPGIEYVIGRYLPFLRILDGYRIHLAVIFSVTAIATAILVWAGSDAPVNSAGTTTNSDAASVLTVD